ncbi:YihY/virulence factor BrkB family protein [Clostridium lundense]|uniref:YihY/virulence factor BrkB family protein n=1 Tax=Clostridium lundense TaxID=319475 RepID=UPI00054F219B|nr:YihY/virulence factor BrkB family protein [Clostridium lundense]
MNIKDLIQRILDDEIPALASQLSYSLLLAFFPFLIFLMTLVGFSSIDSEFVLSEISRVLPNNAYELVHNTVLEILETKNTNLLSFGIIFTLWTASSGFRSVIKGINKAYDEKEKRSFFKVVLISIISTLGLGFLIILTILLLVFGQIIGYILAKKIGVSYLFEVIWNVIRYMIILFSMILIFALMYRYIPSRRLQWKEVIPGAIFATVGWVIASVGFAFYVNNFGNYSRVYGSIGAVIVLLTWLYLTSIIIIVGGEINAAIAFNKDIKSRN